MSRERDSEPASSAHSAGDREARRRGTIVISGHSAEPPADFSDVFQRVFSELAPLHASFARDGLLAVAIWNGRLLADYIHVPLAREPEFVVVGRHDRCDLSLHLDPAMSLRHAVISACTSGAEMRVRFLDLQSGLGFHTEDGQRCEALTGDGAMFVRMGSYHLLLLPTGSLSPLPWCATAEESWKTIPERVYRDCRVAPRHPAVAMAIPPEPTRRRTIITKIVEPPGLLRPPRPAPGARGARVARIEMASTTGQERFSLHEAELERGILIGRYERCQLGASDDNMSRVHLLIIRDGGETWAIDTASTNGTKVDGEPVRRAPLHEGTVLELGKEIMLRWQAAPPDSEGPTESSTPP